MEVQNKVVLVTGSSSGIGAAIVRKLASKGANMIIHYNSNKQGAEDLLKEISSFSMDNLVVQADMGEGSSIKNMFKEISDKYGKLDVLINNAASPSEIKPYWDAEYDDVSKLLDINVVGTMMCSKLGVELLKQSDKGVIINTSSIKGWEYGGSSVGYAVSKAAINSFSRTLAKHVAPNIRVNAIAPGYVRTRVYDGQPQEKIDKWLSGTLLKEWVDMDDLIKTYEYVIENDAITGQVLYVDGGFTSKF